jgi:uncharacterized protein YkwD/uncharacterized membrane protein required for colicin V production
MNSVDLALVAILIAYGIAGYYRGFLLGFASLFGLAFTLVATWFLYRPVSEQLTGVFSPAVAPAVAFIGLLAGMYLAFSLGFKLLFKLIPEEVRKSRVNRVFGVLPGLVDGATMLVLGLVIVVTLPSDQVPRDAISNSHLGGSLLKVGLKAQQAILETFGGAMRAVVPIRMREPEPGESVKLPFHTGEGRPAPDLEKKMWALVNAERTKRGLNALRWDDRLRDVGRLHSQDMLRRGYFAHADPEGKTVADRMKARDLTYVVVGENLALAPTLPIAHEGLMESPGHRANILHPEFERLGVGAIDARPYGIMFTQVFAK